MPDTGALPISKAPSESAASLAGGAGLEALTDRISAGLGTYFPDMRKSGARIVGRAIGGRYAKTFRFEITSGDSRRVAFAKICPIYEALDPARLEFETLTLLHEGMPGIDASLAVSRPVAYFPDLSAYVMESVGTRDLRSYLLKRNSLACRASGVSELVSAVAGCARWLRVFHELTRTSQVATFGAGSFISSLTGECDYRALLGFKFPRATLRVIEEALEGLTAVEGAPTPCAKWHWDYTPGHVYLDGGKTSVIDILGKDSVPIYEDIGHFLAALSSTNNLPLHPLYDFRRARTLLSTAFLNEYHNGAAGEKENCVLLSSIYWLKYLVSYFNSQTMLVSQKTRPTLGRAYANLRLTMVFDPPLADTARTIRDMTRSGSRRR